VDGIDRNDMDQGLILPNIYLKNFKLKNLIYLLAKGYIGDCWFEAHFSNNNFIQLINY
jgi:hypothetical protein